MENASTLFRPARLLIRAPLLGVAVLLNGCHAGILDPEGPITAAERLILVDATVTMLAVVGPVIILTLAFGWWFRAGNTRAKYLPNWSYSGRLELVVWAIPALVVLFLGGMAWVATHRLDPPREIASPVEPLEVQVVSLDWKWLFIYPKQGIASVNQLVVPAGTPIRLRLTSASVMNSFFVPQLAGQIYTMHGMTTRLNLLADHAGTYQGLSSQFSGDGFSDMRFNVIAKSPVDFSAWVQATQAAPASLDEAAYQALVKPSAKVAPSVFGSARPGLFDEVSAGHPPAPIMPAEAQKFSDTSPRERH